MNHLGKFLFWKYNTLEVCSRLIIHIKILHCVSILVKGHCNHIKRKWEGKKPIFYSFLYSFFFYFSNFSFDWNQYIVSAVIYTLSIMVIMMVLAVLTKKYGHRVRRFIRDVVDKLSWDTTTGWHRNGYGGWNTAFIPWISTTCTAAMTTTPSNPYCTWTGTCIAMIINTAPTQRPRSHVWIPNLHDLYPLT